MRLYQRQIGGSWYYEFQLNGVRVDESSKTKSKTLASQIADKRHKDMLLNMHGVKPKAKFQTLTVAFEAWLEQSKDKWGRRDDAWGRYAEKSDTYRMHTNSWRHLKPFFGQMLIHEIEEKDVLRYISQRSKARKANGKHYSNVSINRELTTLRQLLSKHKLWGKLKEGSDIRKLEESASAGIFLEDQQVRLLLDACRQSASKALYPGVLLSILIGGNKKEIFTLQWSQVDLDRRLVTIGKSKNKGRTGRLIDLTERAVTLLHWWRIQVQDLMNVEIHPNHYVFPRMLYAYHGVKGKLKSEGVTRCYSIDPAQPVQSMQKAWISAMKKAGVECRWHDLRHTCVSVVGSNPLVTEKLMQDIFGWMNPEMIQRYLHTRKNARKDAMQTLDAWGALDGLDGPQQTQTIN